MSGEEFYEPWDPEYNYYIDFCEKNGFDPESSRSRIEYEFGREDKKYYQEERKVPDSMKKFTISETEKKIGNKIKENLTLDGIGVKVNAAMVEVALEIVETKDDKTEPYIAVGVDLLNLKPKFGLEFYIVYTNAPTGREYEQGFISTGFSIPISSKGSFTSSYSRGFDLSLKPTQTTSQTYGFSTPTEPSLRVGISWYLRLNQLLIK